MKLLDFFDKIIEKTHRCDKNVHLYSYGYRRNTDGEIVSYSWEHRCKICGKVIDKVEESVWCPNDVRRAMSYLYNV